MMNYSTKTASMIILLLCISIGGHAQEEERMSTNGFEFTPNRRSDNRDQENRSNCPDLEFRTIDGTCNNIRRQDQTDWGAADIQLLRTMLPEYGAEDHYNAMGGSDRPSAREVSNALCSHEEDAPSAQGLSSFVFTWGQFLDHDISLTPEGHVEYAPIELPSDEGLFSLEIPFFRSAVEEDTGDGNYREQTNLITSYIDGSNVYGSDQERAEWLRTFEGGKLKTSLGNLLPYNTASGEKNGILDASAPSMAGDNDGTTITFVAGDVRAAEQPGLTSLHTLFVRYHNNLCDELAATGLSNDEEIYQQARKVVGGVIQSITYNEFLPALGIRLSRSRGYNVNTRADISNIFATAAYRLGHTMVTDELLIKNDACENVDDGVVTLLEGFFNPSLIEEYNIEPFLSGLATQTQNEVDAKVIDNLRNFLFGDPSAGPVFGLDLASLNIQRGRDHGLPHYNAVRRHYLGRAARSFREISSDAEIQSTLENTYGDVNNIDLWVGLLVEDIENRSSLGSTLHAIFEDQFERLRDGDRYFYLNDRFLDRRLVNQIDRTTLSDIIRDNTSIVNIQDDVFHAEPCEASSTSNILFAENRNIEETDNLKMSLYPNPASDYVNIKLENKSEEKVEFLVFDMLGAVVMRAQLVGVEDKIDVSSLNDGAYQVVVGTGIHQLVKTFVKTSL